MTEPMTNEWDVGEYDSAAEWCAGRGLRGVPGDPLPANLSAPVAREIREHPEEFADHVRLTAYAISMERRREEARVERVRLQAYMATLLPPEGPTDD